MTRATSRNELILILRRATSSIAIVVTVVFLWIGLSVQRIPIGHLVFASAVVSVPITLISATTVSNDGFALLGGGLTFLGLLRMSTQRPRPFDAGIVSAGLTIGGLAKLTSALLCTSAVVWTVGLCCVCTRRRRRSVKLLTWAMVAGLIAPGAYYLHVYRHYGTVQPSPFTVAPEEIQASPFYCADNGRPRLRPGEWTRHFVYLLGMTWVNPVLQGAFLDRESPFEVGGLLLVPPLAALGCAAGLSRRRGRHPWALPVLGCLLAIATMAAVHLVFSYRAHLRLGYMGGVQARYYLPMLPAIATAAAHGVTLISRSWCRVAFAALLAASLLFSDTFSILHDAATLTWTY